MKIAVSQIIIVGTFPPPTHGAAVINSQVSQLLKKTIKNIKKLNTAVPILGRYYSAKKGTIKNWIYLIIRLLVFCWNYLKLITFLFCPRRRHTIVYVGLSAGLALFFDKLFAKTSCKLGATVILHHHSFKYVEAFDKNMDCISSLTGNLIHIFLCNSMKQRMQILYPKINLHDFKVIGNSWIYTFQPPSLRKLKNQFIKPLVIGHLSNLSEAKGFFQVAKIFEDLYEQDISVHLHLAGPAEPDVLHKIKSMLVQFKDRVTYLGSIEGDRKALWYEEIDVFLFPSTLTEAYPLVMVESLSAGVPFLARKRGCMTDILSSADWVFNDEVFEAAVKKKLIEYSYDLNKYNNDKIHAIEIFDQMKCKDIEALNLFLNQIIY